MPDYNDLAEKGEAAFQAVLIAAITPIPASQIFTAFSDQTETVGPHSVHIACQGGIEQGFGSGNERLAFVIAVRSNADRNDQDEAGLPRARHRERVAKVFDVLKQDPATLAAALSAAVPHFTVFNGITIRRGPNRTDSKARKFSSELVVECSCAPSSIG